MERKFNLKPRKSQSTDYSHHKTVHLGAAPLQDELLFLSPILSQGNTEHCSAYGAVAIRDSMKQKIYDPEAQWQEELEMGATESGSDVQTTMATGCEKGFVILATTERVDNASCYLWVYKNNGQDLFDSARRALQDAGCPLGTGTLWKNEWDASIGGMIETPGATTLGGHFVKLAGFKQINSIPYIVVQNSWGLDAPGSDNGLYYFPRDVFNQCFNEFGISYWSDDPTLKIKKMGLLLSLYINLLNWLKQLQNGVPIQRFSPLIHSFALAIQSFEGFIAPCIRYPLGTASWRNNNPGNMRYTPYSVSLGATGKSLVGFAKFPTYQIGFDALCQMLTDACSGKLPAYDPSKGLVAFFSIYAPSSDGANNPLRYASVVATKMNINVAQPISTFL